jgi:hypothetical protein
MKITTIALAVFLTLAISAPVCAQDHPTAECCSPEKQAECKAGLASLVESLESLRLQVERTQREINAGRKLTSKEADRMLEKMAPIQQSFPDTEGFMWDN